MAWCVLNIFSGLLLGTEPECIAFEQGSEAMGNKPSLYLHLECQDIISGFLRREERNNLALANFGASLDFTFHCKTSREAEDVIRILAKWKFLHLKQIQVIGDAEIKRSFQFSPVNLAKLRNWNKKQASFVYGKPSTLTIFCEEFVNAPSKLLSIIASARRTLVELKLENVAIFDTPIRTYCYKLELPMLTTVYFQAVLAATIQIEASRLETAELHLEESSNFGNFKSCGRLRKLRASALSERALIGLKNVKDLHIEFIGRDVLNLASCQKLQSLNIGNIGSRSQVVLPDGIEECEISCKSSSNALEDLTAFLATSANLPLTKLRISGLKASDLEALMESFPALGMALSM